MHSLVAATVSESNYKDYGFTFTQMYKKSVNISVKKLMTAGGLSC